MRSLSDKNKFMHYIAEKAKCLKVFSHKSWQSHPQMMERGAVCMKNVLCYCQLLAVRSLVVLLNGSLWGSDGYCTYFDNYHWPGKAGTVVPRHMVEALFVEANQNLQIQALFTFSHLMLDSPFALNIPCPYFPFFLITVSSSASLVQHLVFENQLGAFFSAFLDYGLSVFHSTYLFFLSLQSHYYLTLLSLDYLHWCLLGQPSQTKQGQDQYYRSSH